METAKIAFAPSRDLVSVPSSSTSALSTSACPSKECQAKASCMAPPTFAAAVRHPRPPYRCGSPSLSSSASAEPVEAPEGTDAVPTAVLSSSQVAFRVGRPRLSKISSPVKRAIFDIALQPPHEGLGQLRYALGRVWQESEHRLSLAGELSFVQVL